MLEKTGWLAAGILSIFFLMGVMNAKFVSPNDGAPDFISTAMSGTESTRESVEPDKTTKSDEEILQEAIEGGEFIIHAPGIVEYKGMLCTRALGKWQITRIK